jgi:hypothetical protein
MLAPYTHSHSLTLSLSQPHCHSYTLLHQVRGRVYVVDSDGGTVRVWCTSAWDVLGDIALRDGDTGGAFAALALYCVALYYTTDVIFHCIVLQWMHTVLYCTVLYYTALYYITLHCTVLYYTTLYCTELHCTVLY